jgi:hypothetical protein
MPGADFRTLLDAFNDRWVATARFLSGAVVIELLRAAGDWTADFYEHVDLESPCEPVGFFAMVGPPGMSPYWQAIAREFVERWVHHSQIRRALGLRALAEERFVRTGVDVVAAAAGVEPRFDGARWSLGEVVLGDSQQAADLLTRRYTAAEIPPLVDGPAEGVALVAGAFGRPG